MMKYNTQTDLKWKAESMGLPIDTLGRWGCLVTSLSNILQECCQHELSPKEVNDKLKKNNGYKGAKFVGKESFIDWEVTSKLFNLIMIRCPYRIYRSDFNDGYYFIGRIIHPITKAGHYINVIAAAGVYYSCFDVETGELKLINYSEITDLLKINVQC